MRWLWLCLGLSGCAGPQGATCGPGGDPTLQIGLGVGTFTPIVAGEMPLIHGPQGGWHLEIGLLATGIDASDLIVGRLQGTVDGEPIAVNAPWLDMRCDEAAGGLISWGTRLIYPTETAAELDGVQTEVSAEITDNQGITISTTQTFVIRDEG